MLDTIIRRALIVDGSGDHPFYGDIGIRGGRIAAVGEVDEACRTVVDADGLVASPGFIDVHSHTDASVLMDGRAQSKITQGVTTEITGNCGFSPAPCFDEAALDNPIHGRLDYGAEWESVADFLSVLDGCSMTVNVGMLVGHGNIRRAVIGSDDREPTAEEMRTMCQLLVHTLLDGALGISTGLIYPPGCYSTTAELAELAGSAASHGAVYTSHIRDEHEGVVQAVAEALEIAERSAVSMVISHHKACGRSNWNKIDTTLAMIDDARARGLGVHADQYPYVASSTYLSVALPAWVHEGGTEATLRRMVERRGEMLSLLAESASGGRVSDDGGWERILISSVEDQAHKWAEGKSVADVARVQGCTPEEAVLDLLIAGKCSVLGVMFNQSEEVLEKVMRRPWVMVGSDGAAFAKDGPLSFGKPHPRAYGTFPRVLGRYVREKGVVSLQEAVRKMTSLPAEKFGIGDRGQISPGMAADIVLFDPESIRDTATFTDPHSTSEGIHRIYVNGVLTLLDGELTGNTAGKAIRSGKHA